MGEIRVGVSGWKYPSWRGDFYPQGLVQRRELEYVGSRMNAVEVNGSFYSLLRPSTYRNLVEETPDDFAIAVKGGRFLTHMMRLVDVDTALANFLASGLLLLGEQARARPLAASARPGPSTSSAWAPSSSCSRAPRRRPRGSPGSTTPSSPTTAR